MHIKNTFEEFQTAVSRMLHSFVPDTELVPLEACPGRILAGDIAAGESIPGFDRATSEGFAVRAADTTRASTGTPIMLANVGEAVPGMLPDMALAADQCAYVPAGGAIPEGADSIVLSGNASIMGADTSTIYIESPQGRGENIAFAANDIVKGSTILKKGSTVDAKSIAILAAMGIERVPLFKRPSIGLLSVGDELVGIDSELSGAYFRDANSHMMQALLRNIALEPNIYGHTSNDGKAMDSLLARLCGHNDAVIVSGDYSSVDLDEKNSCLCMLGGISIFASSLGGVPIFILPGLPQQAYFMCRALLEPSLASMAGKANHTPIKLKATLECNATGSGWLAPVSIDTSDEGYVASPMDLSRCTTLSMLGMDGYLLLEKDTPLLEGDIVEINLFRNY